MPDHRSNQPLCGKAGLTFRTKIGSTPVYLT